MELLVVNHQRFVYVLRQTLFEIITRLFESITKWPCIDFYSTKSVTSFLAMSDKYSII